MAEYRILRADFRETLAACEGQAALIAMSPPYPSGARTCYDSLEWSDYQALGDAVKAALLPGGHCLMNLSAPVRQLREGHGTERDPMPWRVALDWYDRVELTVPDWIAFGRKGVPGKFPGFRSGWEPLFWFVRPGAKFSLYKERLKTKAGGPRKRGSVWTRRPHGGADKPRPHAKGWPDKVDRDSLWDYGTLSPNHHLEAEFLAQNHPARWPYRLAADIVACFSDVGDLVCDPFLGGGTTLAAACDGDRRFIGGDNSPEWAEKSRALADSRYAQMTIGPCAMVG